MRTITLGFSKSSFSFAPYSWLIMGVLGISFSHCYLKFHLDEENKDIYYQASKDLVNMMSSSAFLAIETVYKEYEFQVSDANFAKIKSFCYDQLGKPYGVMEVVGLGVMIAASWIGIKMANPFTDGTSSFFCSDLIAYLLEQCENVKLPNDIATYTPRDIYRLVKTLPKTLS